MLKKLLNKLFSSEPKDEIIPTDRNFRFKNIHKVSDIVDAMIKGLKYQWVKVNMNTFGSSINGVCFGCAATNTVCELMQEPFIPDNITNHRQVQFNYGISYEYLRVFEDSIDDLRCGFPYLFLDRLTNLTHITGVEITHDLMNLVDTYPGELPCLETNNYQRLLIHYEEFRDWLKEQGY